MGDTTPGIRVTTTDLLTGESESVELRPDQFVVICADDRYVASEQAYANGTNVVTIKRASL